jgi:putative endonuclease
MTNTHLSIGQQGENHARTFLRAQGFTILDNNWRCPLGELDIIAEQDELLVFVEVKTRHTTDAGDALALVTPRKRERLLRAIYHYLEAKALESRQWRVDVIAVTLTRGQVTIHHVEDALDW